MSELPKIAIDRLRAQQSGEAADSHPDSNALTAFVEGGLNAPERAQMLVHLGTCQVCREVVSLSLPEEESGTAVLPANQGSRGWGIGRWGWGALAASAVIVAGAVLLLNPKHTSRNDIISQVRPSQEIAAKEAPSPPLLADAPKSKSADASAKADAATALGKPTKSLAFTRSPVVPAAEAPPADSSHAATTVPSMAANSLADESKRDAKSVHGNLAASSVGKAQSANGGVLASVLESSNAHGSAPGVGGGDFRVSPSAPQIARVEKPVINPAQENGQVAPPPATHAKQAATEENAQVSYAPSSSPLTDIAAEKDRKTSDRISATTGSVDVRSEDAQIDLQTARLNTNFVNQTAAWHLTHGRLLTKSEPGGSWHEVNLPSNPKLRALAVQSGEIWVGGEKGVLYHSMDAGKTWILIAGDWSKESGIIALKFQDAQHGELTTSQKERWITSDNGKSWQKR